MLKRLRINNFQVHKKLDIDFDKRITVITGSSDAGKSAVLRAIWWALANDPSSGNIRAGASRSRVRVDFGKRTIIRTKGKGVNTYKLDDKVFKAFGSSVPPEIAKLANVSEVNYQGQLDPHFWFSLTPGEVSKRLNEIVNLGEIDAVLTHLASVQRKARTTVEVTRDRLKAAREERKELDWVPKAAKDYERLEHLQSIADRKQERYESAAAIIKDVRRIEQRAAISAEATAQANSVLSLGAATIKATDKFEELKGLLDRIKGIRNELCQAKEKIESLKEKLEGVEVCPTCGQPV